MQKHVGIVPYTELAIQEIQQPEVFTHFGGGKSSDPNLFDWLQVPFPAVLQVPGGIITSQQVALLDHLSCSEPNSIKKNIKCSNHHRSTSGSVPLMKTTQRTGPWLTGSHVFEEGVEFGWPIGQGRRCDPFGVVGVVLMVLIIKFHLRKPNCFCHFLGFQNKNWATTSFHQNFWESYLEPNFSSLPKCFGSVDQNYLSFPDLGRLVFWHTSPSQETWHDWTGCWVGGCWWHETCGFSGGLLQPQKMMPKDC